VGLTGIMKVVMSVFGFFRGVLDMRRRHLARRHSKRLFRKHASKVHRRNVHAHPMRGGIRF